LGLLPACQKSYTSNQIVLAATSSIRSFPLKILCLTLSFSSGSPLSTRCHFPTVFPTLSSRVLVVLAKFAVLTSGPSKTHWLCSPSALLLCGHAQTTSPVDGTAPAQTVLGCVRHCCLSKVEQPLVLITPKKPSYWHRADISLVLDVGLRIPVRT